MFESVTFERRCRRLASRVGRLVRGLVYQLPDQPYPSEHPWSRHHGGTPVG
jgi:hypothetical protein